MARKKRSEGAAVGDNGFYKWKGEALPAVVVATIDDSEEAEVVLNVFSRNGVMVVSRAKQGNGDSQFSTSADPAVEVVDEEPEEEPAAPVEE